MNSYTRRTHPFIAILWLALGASLAPVGSLSALAGALVPFQARLADPSGKPISDGATVIQFQIFSEPVGGSPAWAGEVHRATVNGGLINVMLGSKNPLPVNRIDDPNRSFFDSTLYLQVTVDASGPEGKSDGRITEADAPLLPRQALVPVHFSQESGRSRDADRLAGRDWQSILTGGSRDPSTGFISGAKIEPAGINLDRLADRVVQQLVPAGSTMAFAGPVGRIPKGWLLCDGRALRSLEYPALFAAIGTAWGDGSNDVDQGTDFNLPDLRGVFLRGNDAQSGRDLESPLRYRLLPGGNSQGEVGSYQNDSTSLPRSSPFRTGPESNTHTHPYFDAWWAEINAGNAGFQGNHDEQDFDNNRIGSTFQTSENSQSHFHTVTTGGDFETRPINASVNYIIKL